MLPVTALLILGASSLSEGLGLQAFLGAFLIGAALSGRSADHREAHDVMAQFTLSFFAPIYFVSMGMTTNYLTHFDGTLVLLILVVTCLSKVGSVLVGARLAGMPLDREAWVIGFGLNARGATGITLAGVGRAAGVIDDRLFVSVVVMALATSLMAGPMLNWSLAHRMGVARLARCRADAEPAGE